LAGDDSKLASAFSSFLDQPGVPLVTAQLACHDGAARLDLAQQRFFPLGSSGAAPQLWKVPVCVRYPAGTGEARECTLLEQQSAELRLANTTGCPGWVEANGESGNFRIEAVVTLWAAGVAASPLGKLLGAPPQVNFDRRGCVVVDDRLNPPGLPEVFVLGDLAHFEQDGRQIPGVAQPAMQMGDHVGKIIAADLAAKPRPAFRYWDKGDMATIGRMAAVADVKWPFKAHLSGFPAWLTWVTVHIFFLIGFRNRLQVLINWAWTYFNFTRGARLIIGDQNLPGWKEHSQDRAKAAD